MHRTLYPPMVEEQLTADLTANQEDVLVRVLAGYTDRRIAAELGTSTDGVRSAMRRIRAKAGARDRAHLVALVYSGAVRVLVPAGEPYAYTEGSQGPSGP